MIYGVEAEIGPTPLAAYAAKAVHFAGLGNSYLTIPSLTATNNNYYSFSMWVKGLCISDNASLQLLLHDPTTWPESFALYGANLDLNFAPGSNQWDGRINGAILSTAWHNIIFSADFSNGAGSRVFALYIDRTLISYSTTFGVGNFYKVTDSGAGAVTGSYNAKAFVFADDSFGDGAVFDAADVWIAPGVSLLSGTTIPDATLDQFIDSNGKPVDPAGWPTSAIQFYGDYTEFATNRGTGGAASLTGSLSAASTHP